MLRINVTTAEAVITETELITSGRKGLRCAFTFSDDWAGLAKTVIVQGAATRDIALLATNEITVPAECVSKAQFPLKIGVYGARPDGTIAIPTIWASFGKVLPGAKPSDIPPDELTPDVVAQIQEAANNALYLARNVQSMADSGALDGVSPAVTVTSITGGHNVKITDRDHPDGQDFDVPDGQDGEDGVSPTISSESITGGHRLTIVDAGGTTTVDVMDGEDGAVGVGVPSSGAAGDVLRKASSTDFDTEWHSPEIFWAVYDSTTADEVEAARIDGKAIMCAYGGRTYIMNYRQTATKFYFTAADRNSFYILSVSGSNWSNVSTKTVGTYSKPSGGIPASDLVSGISVPTGGTTGQVLKKASGTDYDTEWANESGGGGSISPYTSSPAALGTASPGSSDKYARGDHVHDFNSDFVTALLQIASKVAYIDGNGQTYYDALESALTHRTLSSISAVYTQSGTVYDTDSLDSLKTDLVVTATYSDSSTAIVPAADYTLSGTLAEGTSTITVNYGGKTTTFTVTVTAGIVLPAGYEEVDSICNPIGRTSGPYLDTGLTLSGTGDVVVDISFMSYGGETTPYVMGCLSSDSANTIGLGISIQSDYSTIIVFPGTVTSIAPSVVRGVKHNITATVTSTGATITDGTLTDSQTFTPRVHNVAPLYLFGIKKYNSTDVNYPFTGRIYSCVVTEGGVKKLDLVPCVRTSDGMAGFYDLVAETFIGNSTLVAVPKNTTNTVAQIASYDKIFVHSSTEPAFREESKTNGGTTSVYDMDAATTALFPAGIIPTAYFVIDSGGASIFVYDGNGDPVNFVTESGRWGQNVSGTLAEYSKSWNIDGGYSKIAFSLDTRYLDSAYMYDKPTGKIWFAGAATPYYGMSNISEATS